MTAEIIIAILGCSTIAAIVNQIGNYISDRKKHQESQEVEESENVKQLRHSIQVIKDAQKIIMLDRMRYVGQNYLKQEEIDFDDRRIFHQMHDIYHNDLGGNGDLDQLMEAIDDLPLKK